MAALLALSAAPCPVQGQSTVSVLPVQGLRFGMLSPGMPQVVAPTDGARRATLEVLGQGHVTLTFELPAGLTAAPGTTLPLAFGAADGRITFPKSTRVIIFDPRAPVSFNIPPGLGGATIHLGGSAQPGPKQLPGSYTASITVSVVVANAAT